VTTDVSPDALYHRLGDPCPYDDCDQRFLGEHGKQRHLDRQHDERGRYRVRQPKTSLGL